MKLTQVFSGIAIIFCLFVCAGTTHGQYLYGRTEVHYDPSTRLMTARSSTEVDYAAQEFYQGMYIFVSPTATAQLWLLETMLTTTVTASWSTQINSQLVRTIVNIR